MNSRKWLALAAAVVGLFVVVTIISAIIHRDNSSCGSTEPQGANESSIPWWERNAQESASVIAASTAESSAQSDAREPSHEPKPDLTTAELLSGFADGIRAIAYIDKHADEFANLPADEIYAKLRENGFKGEIVERMVALIREKNAKDSAQ